MNPGARELLGQLLDVATRVQADPLHRVNADAIVVLAQTTKVVADAPHVSGPRVVNDFTVQLALMLLKLAVQGPWGDANEVGRARKLIDTLVPFVRQDLADALKREARPAAADHPDTRRARWPN